MQHIVTEYCSHCETEIEMSWDVRVLGYKARGLRWHDEEKTED